MTTDPNQVAALTTFGKHKGYGLSVINEIMGAFIGGSLPTIRSRWGSVENEKHTPAFYFQVIHPDAVSGNAFSQGRSQAENVKSVLEDIVGHGNEQCLLPGQLEARAAARSKQNDGLLFTEAELAAFNQVASECNQPEWDIETLVIAK